MSLILQIAVLSFQNREHTTLFCRHSPASYKTKTINERLMLKIQDFMCSSQIIFAILCRAMPPSSGSIPPQLRNKSKNILVKVITEMSCAADGLFKRYLQKRRGEQTSRVQPSRIPRSLDWDVIKTLCWEQKHSSLTYTAIVRTYSL